MSWDIGKAISKGAFSVGYAIYKTRLGGALHQRACQDQADGKPHSDTISVPLVEGVHVLVTPILADNYCYLLVDEATSTCLAVDPSDGEAILKLVADRSLALSGILTTHGHWDHSGGNDVIKARCPDVKVYGNNKDSLPSLTNNVVEGDMFLFPPRSPGSTPKLVIKVWETPCHTRGHIMFIVCRISDAAPDGEPVGVFTGDTLFLGGTGKFFEGTPAEMAANLQRIGQLPSETKIFCGHEYTVNNYRFAAAVEPDNVQVRERLSDAIESRSKKQPTVPSTVAEEMLTNPYLRIVTSRAACGKLGMALHAVTGDAAYKDGKADSVLVLGELRRVRDENIVKATPEQGAAK